MARQQQKPSAADEVVFEDVAAESGGGVVEWVEAHREKLMYAVGAVAVAVLGYFAYQNFVVKPRQEEARQYFAQAEYYFRVDSFQQAAYGAGPVMGFVDIAEEYGGTDAGNTAALYAGIALRNLGKFEEALEYLEDFDPPTPLTEVIKEGALGDVLAELGRYDEAAEHYEAAATRFNDEIFTPFYLFKAGLMHELAGDYEAAVRWYRRLQEEYPQAPTAANIKGYIARAQAKAIGSGE